SRYVSLYFSGRQSFLNESISRSAISGSRLSTLRIVALDLLDRPDLVGEVELLECDHALSHAQHAEVLALAHHERRDAGRPESSIACASSEYTRSDPSAGPTY